MRTLSTFFAVLFLCLTAAATQGLPEMYLVNYENGLVTLRTRDTISKAVNSLNDRAVIEAYRDQLIAKGYKAASCTQIDGYGLTYAVQCVAYR